jgi:hypothetical protein
MNNQVLFDVCPRRRSLRLQCTWSYSRYRSKYGMDKVYPLAVHRIYILHRHINKGPKLYLAETCLYRSTCSSSTEELNLRALKQKLFHLTGNLIVRGVIPFFWDIF